MAISTVIAPLHRAARSLLLCLSVYMCHLSSLYPVGCITPLKSQVPNSHLLPLVRRMFLRDICLLSGTASNRDFAVLPPSVAAVLAYKYGSVLVEILGSVLGCADALYEHYAVELQHLMTVPQVNIVQ
jgi:hypothetical protein